MNSRITYFVNQYPKVSHSFIRREIMVLERLGFGVQRVALRGWDEAVTDKDDIDEKANKPFCSEAIASPCWRTLRVPRREDHCHYINIVNAENVSGIYCAFLGMLRFFSCQQWKRERMKIVGKNEYLFHAVIESV